jgi:hypothetical protein
MHRICAAAPLLCLLLIPACQRREANETAVRRAIEQYLSSRPNLNMQGMQMDIRTIKVRDERADADVVFSARNDSSASMTMHYSLRRRGGRWEVEPRNPGHGMLPPSGADGAAPGPEALPPGHPAVPKQQ